MKIENLVISSFDTVLVLLNVGAIPGMPTSTANGCQKVKGFLDPLFPCKELLVLPVMADPVGDMAITVIQKN